jgi:hypothetical protein
MSSAFYDPKQLLLHDASKSALPYLRPNIGILPAHRIVPSITNAYCSFIPTVLITTPSKNWTALTPLSH